MFLSVVLLVVFLTLIVLGYNFNINKIGTEEVIERAGLIQIFSVPSGATVTIDGSDGDLFSRTSYSKTLSIGEHVIILKKDGFDSWTKTINIEEGLLRRVTYPRLFLKNRVPEDVVVFFEDELLNSELSFSKDGKSLSLTETGDSGEKIVKRLDLNDGKTSFKEVKISELETEDKIKAEEELKLEKKLEEIRLKLGTKRQSKIELGEYLGESYVVLYGENEAGENYIEIYKEAEILNESVEMPLLKKKIDLKIEKVVFKGRGQLIVLSGTNIGNDDNEAREMIYDFETDDLMEVSLEEGERWFDDFMKYRFLSDGSIEVKDFDGENKRKLKLVFEEELAELAEPAEVIEKYGVKISANNRYIYYFVKVEDKVKLVRERVM